MERIPTIDLCRVPDNYSQINDFINDLPAGSERANATLVMMMTHNFLASVHNKMIDEMLAGAMSADEIKEMLK